MDSTSTPGRAVTGHQGQFSVASAAKDQPDEVVVSLHDAGLMVVLEDVHDRLETLLESGPRELVVDMSDVAQLSSTTIAALLWINQRCSARGVGVVLRAASRRNLETLRRVGLLGAAPERRSSSGTAPKHGRWT